MTIRVAATVKSLRLRHRGAVLLLLLMHLHYGKCSYGGRCNTGCGYPQCKSTSTIVVGPPHFHHPCMCVLVCVCVLVSSSVDKRTHQSLLRLVDHAVTCHMTCMSRCHAVTCHISQACHAVTLSHTCHAVTLID
jgi:hypothetical protein